jgi:hypothetical protein
MTHVFGAPDQPDGLLRLQFPNVACPVQIRALIETAPAPNRSAPAVVTTQYHWQAALGDTAKI